MPTQTASSLKNSSMGPISKKLISADCRRFSCGRTAPVTFSRANVGIGTGAPPEKHATNISKRPLILARLPVEIPQPKQSRHEPQNRKNRHQIITSELTLLALDRITQSYRRAKASTAANKPAGQCFWRAGEIKSDLSHAIGPAFCRSEERRTTGNPAFRAGRSHSANGTIPVRGCTKSALRIQRLTTLEIHYDRICCAVPIIKITVRTAG